MKKNKQNDFKQANFYFAGLGVISMGIGANGDFGYFSTQNLKNIKKVGAKVQEKDIEKTSTQSVIVFTTVESVDNAIGKLERLKKLMTKRTRKKKK